MTLIGLTGYANSGKDTVAEILVREHGFKRYAFADKLREMVYAINPHVRWGEHEGIPLVDRLADIVDADGWDKAKREIPEVRELLQRVGVWHRENLGEWVWVNLVKDQWLADGQPDAVITDVRFPNEARFVRNYRGHVVRIHRPGVGPVNGHVSEAQDFDVHSEILNDGNLEDLAIAVDDLVWFLSLKGAA